VHIERNRAITAAIKCCNVEERIKLLIVLFSVVNCVVSVVNCVDLVANCVVLCIVCVYTCKCVLY
jgi:hypothetical protein